MFLVLEAIYKELRGIEKVVSGDSVSNPSYQEVSRGTTVLGLNINYPKRDNRKTIACPY
jgi:peptide methionine sulfoxide reductase MsrA